MKKRRNEKERVTIHIHIRRGQERPLEEMGALKVSLNNW